MVLSCSRGLNHNAALGKAVSTGLQNQVELEHLNLGSSQFAHKEFSSPLITLSCTESNWQKITCSPEAAEFFCSLLHLHLLSKAEG